MTVYKRDGKYRVFVDVGADPITGKRKRASGGTHRTKREAKAAEARLEADREKGLLGITTRSTVAEFLATWLSRKAEKGSPTSRADREHLVNRYIVPALGTIPLAKLTPAQVDGFLDRMRKDGKIRGGGGLSASRRIALYQILAASMKYAVRKGYLTRNIMEAVDRPERDKPKAAQLPWTTEVMDRFLAAIEGDDWRALYWLAMFGGLRRAELLGLRWADVHLEDGYLLVRETWVHAPDPQEREKGPKSESGRRVVTLGPGCVEALIRHRAQQRELSMKHRIVWEDNDLVFCRQDGRHCYPTAPTQRFGKLVERLGLPHITLHDLRKIAASLANVASQGDARSVSDRLGHSRVDTSQQIYVKGLVERQRGIADGVEQLVRRRG